MIISRTPFRISFFGGGTDYTPYFKDHPGASLVTTIDKYCYITARWLPPFFGHRSRIVYSKIELIERPNQISHPAVREAIKYLNIDKGLEIHHDADLPARTGLGSSSAFAVGLLNALHVLNHTREYDSLKLAEQAIYLEQTLCNENVGCQDQISTAIGGLNHLQFKWQQERNAPHFEVNKIGISQQRIKELESNLMLFFTGFSRTASEVAKSQLQEMPNKIKELKRMYQMVQEGIDILHSGRIEDFGYLLNESWQIKRGLSNKISNNFIDNLYKVCLNNGAIGGKILGAGGGGFLLLYVEPENQKKVSSALKDFLQVPFRFENTGTEIIFNNT